MEREFMIIGQIPEYNNNYSSASSRDNVKEASGQIIDYSEILRAKQQEIREKLKNGDTEESFNIGGASYTNKEWSRLLSKFDNTLDEMRKVMREEIAKRTGRVEENKVKQHKAVNEYFAMAKDGVVSYKGVDFICDYKTNTLMLGDCSNSDNCIRVALSNGGSLMFNRDNISSLGDAISLFSPEDINRIMRAIQMDKMANDALRDIEEEDNGKTLSENIEAIEEPTTV